MRARAAALLALVAVGIAAWLCWPEAQLEPAGAPAVATPLHEPPAASTPLLQPIAAPAPRRDPLPEEAAPEGSTVLLRVLLQETGAPAAGAELYYWEEPPDPASLSPEELAEDPGPLLRRLGGTRVVVPPSGSVRLRVKAWTPLVAELDGAYGRLALGPGLPEPPGGWTLWLERDCRLRVRVLASDGTPAGMVEIATRARPKDSETEVVAPIGTSGADGTLEVVHAQRLAGSWQRDATGRVLAQIVPHLPGVPPQGPAVDLLAPPSEPVLLTLPPTGSLRILVRDARGAAPPGAHVQLGASAVPGLSVPHWSASGADVTFPRVGLGQTLHGMAGADLRHVARGVAGPTVSGETAEVTLAFADAAAVLAGRALDEHGQPLRGATLQVSYGGPASASLGTAADQGGGFRCTLPPNAVGRTLEDVQIESGQGCARLGTIGPLAAGERWLGDVTLTPLPVVVAGRIVVAEPAELAAVQLRLERWMPANPERRQPERWEAGMQPRCERSPDGAFALLGHVPPGRLRLGVESRLHLPITPVEVAPGVQDVVLTLVRGGSVVAVALTDAELAPSLLQLRLHGASLPHRRLGMLAQSNGGQHAFLWEGLAPGTYRLEVATGAVLRPLATVDGIALQAGRAADDPRLRAIDLRGRLHRLAVKVTDPAGQPVHAPLGCVVVLDADPAATLGGQGLTDGSAVLLLPALPVDLLVSVQGFLPVELRAVRDDVAMTLTPSPSLRLELSPGSVLPSADAHLWLGLVPLDVGPQDPRAYWAGFSQGTLAELRGQRGPGTTLEAGASQAVLRVALPGRYRVEARRYPRQGNAAPLACEPAEVDVGAADRERPVGLTLRER